jgi:enoyl-CoA hydratase
MNSLVSYHLADGVATLTLANGKVNAISMEVIQEFNQALDRAEQDQAVVLITSNTALLSAGYDLKVMTSGLEQAIPLVTAGSQLSRRLLAHPFPVVVACPGHAIAKGAFLLLSADYRIGVSGPYQIGLNEVQIGMTMPYTGIEIARNRLSAAAFQRSVVNGEMFNPEGALAAGFLDQLVDAEHLSSTAIAVAQSLKKISMKAHRNTKLKVRQALLDTLDAAIELDKSTLSLD